MKLHEINKGSYIRYQSNKLIYFDHLDGMYSICYDIDKDTLAPLKKGDVIRLEAWANVEAVSLDTLFTFEQIREIIGRSGYGRDGAGEWREASLSNMSDNWLSSAISSVQDNDPHLPYYIQETKYRSAMKLEVGEDIYNTLWEID